MQSNTIEREAKLFEAGNYPDKGIEITESDLDVLIANTTEAPIRIEHTPTPFDGSLGVLKSLYRKGKELFGKLIFNEAAWELVKSANAKRLSIALNSDKSEIAEISLVREPRIADAAVFTNSDIVKISCCEIEFSNASDELQRKLCEKTADEYIERFKREGKIVPNSETFAYALLRADDRNLIKFGGSDMRISELFRWFLDSQPKVIEFSEVAKSHIAENEEPEIYTKLGVTSSQVEKHRTR